MAGETKGSTHGGGRALRAARRTAANDGSRAQPAEILAREAREAGRRRAYAIAEQMSASTAPRLALGARLVVAGLVGLFFVALAMGLRG